MSQLPVYVIVFPSGRSYIHHPDYLIQEYIFILAPCLSWSLTSLFNQIPNWCAPCVWRFEESESHIELSLEKMVRCQWMINMTSCWHFEGVYVQIQKTHVILNFSIKTEVKYLTQNTVMRRKWDHILNSKNKSTLKCRCWTTRRTLTDWLLEKAH